jgi:uncharacterized protein YegP (UPF0339 family)
MTTDNTSGDALAQWYEDRIGEAVTGDEVRGYWTFVLGLVLGIAGILLFLPSGPASASRQWAIVLAAAGLALLVAGPLIRLPLRRTATLLVYLGLVVSAIAILWFVVAYPQFRPRADLIVGLYGVGILAMAVGGVFVPLATTRPQLERRTLEAETDQLRQTLLDTEVDRTELSAVVADLRTTLEGTEVERTELEGMVDRLRDDLEDTEADEADLAAELRSLRHSQARFELYEDRVGEYRWRLRHRNGNVVADGGQGYTRRHNAQKGIQSVRRNALGATVLHIENEDSLPDEAETFEPVDVAPSRATVELYADEAGEHRWRLRHDNGNILADSGEGYSSRGAIRTAIDRIRAYVASAEYLRIDPVGIEIYRDRASEWRWRLVHENGNILADSGQGYSRRRDARRAVDRLQNSTGDVEFELYEDRAGEYRWRARSANGRIVADSGEGYTDRSSGKDALERVREYLPTADVLDIGRAAFEIYEDRAGEYRWRLRHRNGNVLADSGQGYSDRNGAREGIESVKLNAPNADTDER